MIFAMTPDEFVNTALPWAAAGFVVVWFVAFLIKILIDLWKDRD